MPQRGSAQERIGMLGYRSRRERRENQVTEMVWKGQDGKGGCAYGYTG